MLSKMRVDSDSLGTLSPRIVRDFSVLGSTATATVCKAHKTGNIVVIAAGSNRSLLGPVVGFHLRASVSRLASIPRVMKKISCVGLCGRTLAAHNVAAKLCSSAGVETARRKLGPLICPGMS